MVSEM